MAMMNLLIFLPVMLIVLCSFAALAFIGVWTYRDAKARGLNATLWVLVVLLVPSMIGLIIYLVAGRNQSVGLCASCSGSLSASDHFCPHCGATLGQEGTEPNTAPRPIPKTNRGPLIGFIVCMALMILAVIGVIGIGMYGSFLFTHNIINSNAVVSNVEVGTMEQNFSNNWNMSFEILNGLQDNRFELSGDETALSVTSTLQSGTLKLKLTQGETEITVDVFNGGQEIDLNEFEPGTLTLTLIADNAQNGSFSATLK